MNKTENKTVNKTVNKNVNKDIDTVFYYNRKIETYKNRIKWLRKQISAINQKIKIYTECQEDFYNSVDVRSRQKLLTKQLTKLITKQLTKLITAQRIQKTANNSKPFIFVVAFGAVSICFYCAVFLIFTFAAEIIF